MFFQGVKKMPDKPHKGGGEQDTNGGNPIPWGKKSRWKNYGDRKKKRNGHKTGKKGGLGTVGVGMCL